MNDKDYMVVVTCAKGEIVHHEAATSWDTADGELYLYHETATRMYQVATYAKDMWLAVTKMSMENWVSTFSEQRLDVEEWETKRHDNRQKLQDKYGKRGS